MTKTLTKRRWQKVDIDLVAKRLDYRDSYKGWYVSYGSFALYQDDGVLHVRTFYQRRWVEDTNDDRLNSYQYFLFRRAMFGLEVYPKDELDHMHREKKQRITHVSRRAHYVINDYIQLIMIHKTNAVFEQLFGGGHITEDLLWYHNETDPEYICKLKLEDLVPVHKRRRVLVHLLVINDVLPKNFFKLTVQDDPRVKKLKEPVQEPLGTL